MKKQILLVLSVIFLSYNAFATQHYITNSSNTYVPSTLTISLGDTVNFVAGVTHTSRQVSFNTWTANDTAALPGGFNNLGPGSMVIPTSAGIIYYVCVEHVAMHQMKGTITVNTVGIESNNSVTMQIMQSVSEQYLKLLVTGNATGEMQIEMLNLSGQLVKKVNMELSGEECSTMIQVGDMPKGVYMIRWSYGSVHKAKKIILQ